MAGEGSPESGNGGVENDLVGKDFDVEAESSALTTTVSSEIPPPPCHSRLFEILVLNESAEADSGPSESMLIGMIAYSYYKLHKYDFVQDFIKRNGRNPTREELQPLHDQCALDSGWAGYVEQAEQVFYGYAEAYADAVWPEKHMATTLKSQHEEEKRHVEAEVGKIEKLMSGGRAYMKSIGLGLITNFVFALLVVIIYFSAEADIISALLDKLQSTEVGSELSKPEN